MFEGYLAYEYYFASLQLALAMLGMGATLRMAEFLAVVRMPVGFVAVALALITTFFYWDELFLFDADDRSLSAGRAFAINPAAAASVPLDFDWMYAKHLYGQSQTAESMFNVPRPGVLPYSLWLLAVGVPFAALAFWRERRA